MNKKKVIKAKKIKIAKKVKRTKKVIRAEEITHLVNAQKDLKDWIEKYRGKIQVGIIIGLLETAKLGYFDNVNEQRKRQ